MILGSVFGLAWGSSRSFTLLPAGTQSTYAIATSLHAPWLLPMGSTCKKSGRWRTEVRVSAGPPWISCVPLLKAQVSITWPFPCSWPAEGSIAAPSPGPCRSGASVCTTCGSFPAPCPYPCKQSFHPIWVCHVFPAGNVTNKGNLYYPKCRT